MTRRQYITVCDTGLATAASRPLLDQWREIASLTDGIVGAAALHLETGQSARLNGARAFPLASVCKLPIALRILSLVGQRKLQLTDEIEVLEQDVWPSWPGDLAESWPQQHHWRLEELLRQMISHSDNTAVHTLFRIAGCATGMSESFRSWRMTGMRVDRYEGECYLASHGVTPALPNREWKPGFIEHLVKQIPLQTQLAGMRTFMADPRDTGTPNATVQLLAKTYRGELLSPSCSAFLQSALEATTTGKNRLKGLLPANTRVAHKTGTTPTIAGLNGATNDVGVITLPRNSGQVAIAVYISGSSRSETTRDQVIAQIAAATYSYWAI